VPGVAGEHKVRPRYHGGSNVNKVFQHAMPKSELCGNMQCDESSPARASRGLAGSAGAHSTATETVASAAARRCASGNAGTANTWFMRSCARAEKGA